MTNQTLFILAAGLGNKYGGMKQQEGIGPNGETILDYSLFDACRSGFNRIVFVVFSSFEKEFKDTILKKYEGIIPIDCITVDVILRTSYPWSSIRALWAGRNILKEPFGIINADDFYGIESFKILNKTINELAESSADYGVNIAFKLKNTISETTSVTRGICYTEEDDLLFVKDCKEVECVGGNLIYNNSDNKRTDIDGEMLASINMWALKPEIFDFMEPFVQKLSVPKESDAEVPPYTITQMMNILLKESRIKVKVKTTSSEWLGFTSAEDRVPLILRINDYIKSGIYPKKLRNNNF